MARYYGDFRSLDTSVDPKGQKYRVLIFTGYNGASPYEYRYVLFPTDTEAGVQVPVVGTSLTMTDRPFVVTYEGDAENIFKPYRCSTAEASFMQSNVNLDFVNSNGTATLVVLLKWKNEVSEVSGRMVDSITGETLNKRRISRVSSLGEEVFFNDYEPYKYDKFCYNVEWIGFSTPETYSMGFDHVRDVFTLNAQDAFSVLQYRKYKWLGTEGENLVAPMLDIILQTVGTLGTYSKVYVTNTVKFPTLSGENATTALSTAGVQQQNHFDEDGKPTDQRTALEAILTYCGLTAVPYKDNLIITTPNAIAEGWGTYNVFALPSGQYFMTFGGGTYTQQPDEQISDTHAVTAESFAEGGTQISTANVVNSATVEDDIYYIDDILPNFSDSDNFKNKVTRNSNLTYGGTRYYWKRNTYESDIDTIVTHQYEDDTYSFTASLIDETTQTYDIVYTITLSETETATPDYGAAMVNHPTCLVMDNYGVDTETPNKKQRVVYFHARPWLYGALPSYYNGQYMANPQCQQNFRTLLDTQSKKQKMLTVTSKGFWKNEGLYMVLSGDWKFFYNRYNNTSPWPHQFDSGLNPDVATNTTRNYVYAKVKCGHYWLANGSTQTAYTWSTTEQFVKLYFDVSDGGKCFDNQFPFKATENGHQGIIVLLPDLDYIGNITIDIFRPLGVATNTASCAILSNLDLQLKTTRELFDDEYSDGRDNREYKTEIDGEAVTELGEMKNTLSSDSDTPANYSQVLKVLSASSLGTMGKVYNVATGRYALPENHATANLACQYSTPTIALNMTLHTPITPYTLLTWAQLPNRNFVVSGEEIDFENETATVDICEVKTASDTGTHTRRNSTRNFRRNGDLIGHSRPTRIERETLEPLIPATLTRTISGHTITTDNELEGLVTVEPQFGENRLLVSVPDGVTMTPSVDANGHLIFNFE